MKRRILALILSLSMIFTMSVVSLSAAAQTGHGEITLESVTAENGESVSMDVLFQNNPGIWGMDLRISYDKSALTLTSVENGDFFQDTEWTPGNLNADTYILSYEASGLEDITTPSGTLATLNFMVSESATAGNYTVSASYRAGDIINVNFDDINPSVTNGKITVTTKPVAATGVSLNKDVLSLMTGESETLVATVQPADATNKAVTWESSDTSVATVDENGEVTAVKAGEAVITVKTADGGFTDTCTVTVDCSHLSTTEVPAVPSTCIEHGHAEYTVCNDCGAVVAGSDAELPLATHSYVENAEEEYLVSAATCVDRAVYYESCSVCGATGTETFEYGDVDSSNHVGETYLVGQKDATCIETGYTGDVYCSSCDNMISAGTETPLAEHTYGEWVETTKSTCTELGEETRVCEVCGADETRPVDATGHTPGEWTEVTAPTCTEEGLEEQRCTVCGDQIATRAITATGHTLGEWTTTIEPTCTEEGEREAFCEECGVRFTEPVPATGHTAGEWEITTPATCTEDGVRTTTCTVCGVEYTEVIPATGHQYGAWTVVKEATETEEGLRERVCSVCGEKESEVIPVLTTEVSDNDENVSETEQNSSNVTENTESSLKSPKTGNELTSIGPVLMIIFTISTVAIVFIRRKRIV